MDLRHLRYFLQVAESKSVLSAARKLRLSQPGLSRQIHDLEGELGVDLFERAGRGSALTSAGEDLLHFARRVLSEAEALRERALALRGGTVGVLTAGATPQTLERLFPPVLRRFREALPRVDVRLIEGHAGTLLTLVNQGELHVAVTPYKPAPELDSRRIGRARLLAIRRVQRGVPQLPTSLDLGALEGQPLLLLQRGYGSRDAFDVACHSARLRPRLFLESNSPSTLLSLVRSGEGIAILPTTTSFRRAGLGVSELTLEGSPIDLELAIHWHRQRYLPPYAQRFIDELAAQAHSEFIKG